MRSNFKLILNNYLNYRTLAGFKVIRCYYHFTFSLMNPLQKYAILQNTSPQWVRERCKHIIPAPVRLRHLVSHVFRTYGPLVDPKTNKPLFTSENWKTAKHVLELIQNGYLSDPPGIPLYTVVGLDKKAGGLSIYRCSRGTNATEGGVHKHIQARLPKCGASIRHVNAMLHDFVLYHNLVVGKLLFLSNQHV